MKIQYVSDIHLEFYKKRIPSIEKVGDILVMLGDIGKPRMHTYQNLIKDVASKFDHVVVIAGNHEYYNSKHTYEETNKFMHDFFQPFENVHFLDNGHIIIKGVKFIGSTLWSKINNYNKLIIHNGMNDYRCIKTKPLIGFIEMKVRKHWITPDFTNNLHDIAVQYIEHEINSTDIDTTQVVVLTHHLPLKNDEFIPKRFHDDMLNDAYFSDLSNLMKKPVALWLFGHCHELIDHTYNNVRLLSNPMGYPQEGNIYETKIIEI